MRTKLLTLAVALAITSVLGHFFAKPLFAQVRSALIQNIDEPGRNPFTVSLRGAPIEASFTVPAGKRYVVQSYDADCDFSTAASPSIFVLSILGGGRFIASSLFSNSTQTEFWGYGTRTMYLDPGTTASLTLEIAPISAVFCQYNVTGYSVNVP